MVEKKSVVGKKKSFFGMVHKRKIHDSDSHDRCPPTNPYSPYVFVAISPLFILLFLLYFGVVYDVVCCPGAY